MEMVAVMAIILMMTVMAIPTFKGFYRQTQEDSVLGQLSRLLRYAHQKAIYKSQQTRMFIAFGPNRFWVFVPEDEDDRFSEEKRESESTLPRGYTFDLVRYPKRDDEETRRRAEIRFFPDGSAEHTVIIVSERDSDDNVVCRIALSVRPNTGKVVIRELREEEDESEVF